MSKDGRKTHTYRNNLNLWDFFKIMPNLLPEEINIQSLWGFFSNYRQKVEKASLKCYRNDTFHHTLK